MSADLLAAATQLDGMAFPQTSASAKRLRAIVAELDAMQTTIERLAEMVPGCGAGCGCCSVCCDEAKTIAAGEEWTPPWEREPIE